MREGIATRMLNEELVLGKKRENEGRKTNLEMKKEVEAFISDEMLVFFYINATFIVSNAVMSDLLLILPEEVKTADLMTHIKTMVNTV